MRLEHRWPVHRQGGQAAVFVVIFTGVLLYSLVSLYKAGKITSEKMQLQNAADAAAYSVALVEARDLNFMSYTNRAMVANEVAIGQMVGLVSWSEFLKSISQFVRWYNSTFLAPPTLGISTTVIEPVAAAWDVITNVIGAGVRTLGTVGVKVLHNMNKVFSIAQQGYHAVTVVFMLTTLDEMIRINSPPRKDASGNVIAPGGHLSDFGLVSLIGHIVSYGAIVGIPGARFTKAYSPTKPADGEGFGRFASITRESRDVFTRARGWSLPLFPPIHFSESIDIVVAAVDISFDLEINLNRRGGSELRHVGTPTTDPATMRGQHFNWSAGDTTAIDFWLGVSIGVELLGIDAGYISIQLRDGFLDIDFSLAGIDLSDILPDIPVPTGVPFGAGGAQAGLKSLNLPQLTPTTLAGQVPLDMYGEAPKSSTAWMWPTPPGAAQRIASNNFQPAYRGLPAYTDVQDVSYTPGFMAPYFMVGLVKEIGDVNATGPDYTGGHLRVLRAEDGAADDEIAAIAKAEAYFSRPLDLPYFRRNDGQGEIGSAFNPFWHARLVDTSWADRIVSLLIQQKQVFLSDLADIFTLPEPPDLSSLLP